MKTIIPNTKRNKPIQKVVEPLTGINPEFIHKPDDKLREAISYEEFRERVIEFARELDNKT